MPHTCAVYVRTDNSKLLLNIKTAQILNLEMMLMAALITAAFFMLSSVQDILVCNLRNLPV